MKIISAILALLLTTATFTFAAPRTTGLYARATVKTPVDDVMLWKGLEVGVCPGGDISFGMAFYSNAEILESRGPTEETPPYVQSYAYAGPVITKSKRLNSVWRMSTSFLLADGWNNRERLPLSEDEHTIVRERFGIFEPAMRIEAVLARHVLVTAGVSYMISFGKGKFYDEWSTWENVAISLGLGLTTR